MNNAFDEGFPLLILSMFLCTIEKVVLLAKQPLFINHATT